MLPRTTGDAPVTEVVRWGHENVLGRRRLLKSSVIIKIKFFSKRTKKKIESRWRSLGSLFEATWSSLIANKCFKKKK